MKQSRVILAIIAGILILLLFVAIPVSFAQAGGRGGRGGGMGGGGRAGGFGGGARSGFIGGGGHPHFHGQGAHHHFHHGHFFFEFGISAFTPAWWWYDPYYYYGGAPPYYPYYGSPYSDYYGYPYYWSDPCLSPDPVYAPYCPPAAGNPYYPGSSVPPIDYPSLAPPVQPESGGEPQITTPLQQPPSPVNE